MFKKIITLITALSLLLSVQLVCFASNTSDFINKDTSSDEFTKLKYDISKEDNHTKSEIFDFESAYKVYTLTHHHISSAYSKHGNIKNAITSQYNWMIPTADNKSLATAELSNDKWSIIGYKEGDSPKNTYVIDKQQISKALDKQSKITGDNIIDYKNIWSPMIYTTFVYIQTSQNEYLIPFGSRPDLTGLENGKIYEAKDAVEILNIKAPPQTDNTKKLDNAGVNSSQNNTDNSNKKSNTFLISGLIVLILLAGIAVYFFKFSKNKNQAQNQ
ncbi:MAG: hypothetical protein WBK75_05540 [Acutalibacteraceae bacterium]